MCNRKVRLNTVVLSLIVLQTISTTIINAQPTITTPEVYSFKQEVFSPVSYYTGQVNITVPLCEIKTNEIIVPVSLNYIGGGGLRAINPYSNVGLGWKLAAGGAITRTKNNVRDEAVYHSTGGSGTLSNEERGFFHWAESSVTTTNEYVRNNVSSYIGCSLTASTGFNARYEYSPDIFSFSFLGYSGYFVMGFDKEFHIQSNDIVKVEKFISTLSGVGEYPIYFRLTANDGTKFTFGSTTGSLELSGGENAEPYQTDAWYLTKIQFTNGRTVTFNYLSNQNTRIHFKSTSYQTIYSTISPVVLDNITFNGGKVVFTSTPSPHNTSGTTDNLPMISQIKLLDVNNNKVNDIYLNYIAKTSNRYYILNSLKVDDKQYSFGYNSTSSLPTYSQALGTDYWGYYNGKSEIHGRINGGYRDIYLNQTLTIPEKVPSATHAKVGILTSLKYPTGETEYYEYEANTYSYAGIQTLGGYYNRFTEEPQIAGGVRIAKITLGNQVRKYKYVNDFDPNNPDYNPGTTSYIGFSSSGILYKIPAVALMSSAEALNFLSTEGEPPLVYSKVIEFLSDKSYTEYNMYSPLNRPDGENSKNANYYYVNANLPNIFNYVSKSTFVGALGKNSSCALERGQFSEIKVYDSSNNLKRVSKYTYNSNPNRYNEYVTGLYLCGTGVLETSQRMSALGFELGYTYLNNTNLAFTNYNSYCIYTFPVSLEKEEVTEYYSGTPVTTTTKFSYNSKKLKSKIVTYNSRGDSTTVKYRYPSDINNGAYSSMVSLNMLNYPIEQTKLKNTNITGSKLTTYKQNSGSYVPDKEYILGITSPLAESSFTYFNGSGKDSRYGSVPELTYNNYSPNGNLRQVTGRDGISTSYLWDALDRYPMAQVKGATYSQISSYNGRNSTYASNTLWNSLKNVVPSSVISTYSYLPLKGMTSSTNNQGVTSYYTYDTSGRLFLVRDDDKNIISKHRYAYKNYPDNGIGGYNALSVSLTTPSVVTLGQSKTANASVTGGSGSYTYNWYLKNSSGTVISSSLGSSSSSYTFSCSQYGTHSIQCNVVDNQLGIDYTYNRNFSCCQSVGSFSMQSGYTNLSSSILNYGSSVSFNMTFYANFSMQPNQSYLVAYVSSDCRPSSTKTFTVYEVMGRTWQVTIYSSGSMYWKMITGTALPAYYSQMTGPISYNK